MKAIRNRTIRGARLVAGVVFCLAAPAACVPPPPAAGGVVPVVAITTVVDTSDSTDVASRCTEADARLRDILKVHGLKRLDVAVYGTGDRSTNGEPVTLVGWTQYRVDRRLFDQLAKLDAARDAWLGGVRKRCEEHLKETGDSPIRLAIQRARDGLIAHCGQLAQHGETCSRQVLAIHSDMRETWDRAVTDRFKGKGKALAPLDLNGVEVVGCGIANHRVQRVDALPARIAAAWKELLGAQVLPFDPSCS